MKIFAVLFGLIALLADPVDYKQVDKYLSTTAVVSQSYFDELLRVEPSSGYLVGMKIYFLISAVGVDQAETWLRDHKQKYPNEKKFKTYLDLAEASILRFKNKTAEGVALLEKALKEDPTNKWLKLELYYSIPREPKGRELITSMTKDYPDFGWSNLERIYQLDFKQDSAELVALEKKIPDALIDWDMMAYLGEFHYFCKQFEEARELYLRSLEMEENAHALTALGVYENEINFDTGKAEEYFKSAVAADTTYAWGFTSYGWLLFDLEEDERAEEMFRKGWVHGQDEESGTEFTIFYLATLQFPKAKAVTDDLIKKFGSSYVNEAFVLAGKAGSGGDITADKADYIGRYGQVAADYLAEILKMIGK